MLTTRATVLAAEEEINPILPHLSEIILGLVVFGILFWLIRTRVAPRFEAAYAKRVDEIQGGLERAERAQAEATAAREKYQAQLADARGEAARIRDDARIEGQRIVDEMRAQAQAESQRIVAQGEGQLAAQRGQVTTQLRGDLGRLAVDLAGRVVGESLQDEARRRGTVDRFLAELEATADGGGTGAATPADAGGPTSGDRVSR